MKFTRSFLFALSAVVAVIGSCSSENTQQNSTIDGPENAAPVEASAIPVAETSGVPAGNNDTITLPSGLQMIILKEGEGKRPTAGKKVTVHYTGYLTDGNKFDSSVDRGEPFQFTIGAGEVIKGWDEGVALLNVGSKARLIIPHQLGYGVNGYPGVIPPSATLIFDVELLGAE